MFVNVTLLLLLFVCLLPQKLLFVY